MIDAEIPTRRIVGRGRAVAATSSGQVGDLLFYAIRLRERQAIRPAAGFTLWQDAPEGVVFWQQLTETAPPPATFDWPNVCDFDVEVWLVPHELALKLSPRRP